MRLPPRLRWALHATAVLVALSGMAWLVAHYWMPGGGRSTAAVSLEVHGGATMVLLALVGSAVALHAPAGWREAKNRASGALLSGVLIVLALTGFLLYYAGDEQARAASSILHWLVGLAAPAVMALHIRLGRRSLPQSNSDTPRRGAARQGSG